jgi:hypothetical protein
MPREFPLVRRFHRGRWSKTRKGIDALKVGESMTIAATELNNGTTSIQRLEEAYEYTRIWKINKVAKGYRIERTK